MTSRAWTQEELLVVWLNRFTKNSKQLAELIPERTARSVKNVKGKFKKINPEHEDYIKRNSALEPSRLIDEKFGFPPETTSLYVRMKDLPYVMRVDGFTKEEKEAIEKYRDTHTHKEIAEMVDSNPDRIRNLASKTGLLKKFVWTEDKINNVLSELDKGKTLEEAGSIYNRTENAVRVMLNLNELYEYIPESYASRYTASRPEEYIIERLNKEFNLSIPKKCRENKDYYWGIIPPMEVDVPFYINGEQFAIEHDATHWHSSPNRIKNDELKKELLLEKGFHYFKITDKMYKHNNLKSMDPVLDKICDEIREILN